MIPTDCPDCKGAGTQGHETNGPCETCGGWTDKKRLIHRTKEVIKNAVENGIICTVDPDDCAKVNITMRQVNPFLVIETLISDDVKLETAPQSAVDREKAMEWFKNIKPRTEEVASGSFRIKADAFDDLIQKADAEISKLILGPPDIAPNASESPKGVPGHNQDESVLAPLPEEGWGAPKLTTGERLDGVREVLTLEAPMPDETEDEFRERMKETFAAKFGPDPTGTYVPISDPPKGMVAIELETPRHIRGTWKDGVAYFVCFECRQWFRPQPKCPACGAAENPPKETE